MLKIVQVINLIGLHVLYIDKGHDPFKIREEFLHTKMEKRTSELLSKIIALPCICRLEEWDRVDYS